MHLSIKGVSRHMLSTLVLAGCVMASGEDDSEQPATGVPGTTATAGSGESTGSSGAGDGACTAPGETSGGMTGAGSTGGGKDTGGSESGDDGEDGGSSGEAGGGSTGAGGETGDGGETGSTGADTGESTGGSTGDAGGSTGGDGVGPSFAVDIWPIFDEECGCHMSKKGEGKLSLKENVAYEQMINQPSSQLPTMMRITPGSAADSYVWHKLDDTHKSVGGKGKVMPPGGKLDMAQLDLIKQWIDTGAAP